MCLLMHAWSRRLLRSLTDVPIQAHKVRRDNGVGWREGMTVDRWMLFTVFICASQLEHWRLDASCSQCVSTATAQLQVHSTEGWGQTDDGCKISVWKV